VVVSERTRDRFGSRLAHRVLEGVLVMAMTIESARLVLNCALYYCIVDRKVSMGEKENEC
jgi:hypothetical protein